MILPIAQGEVGDLVPRIYVLNFESAMMCRNSVKFSNLRIMNDMFVISLTHEIFCYSHTFY